MVLAKFCAFLTVKGAPAPAKNQPLRIGILGSDATTAAAQKSLPGRRVDGRPVQLVVLDEDDAKNGRTDKCDLIYVATDIEAEVVAAVVAAHRTLPRPVIAEHQGFAATGGGIQLFLSGDKVCFEVNQETLKTQGVTPAAQLLNLSKRAP